MREMQTNDGSHSQDTFLHSTPMDGTDQTNEKPNRRRKKSRWSSMDSDISGDHSTRAIPSVVRKSDVRDSRIRVKSIKRASQSFENKAKEPAEKKNNVVSTMDDMEFFKHLTNPNNMLALINLVGQMSDDCTFADMKEIIEKAKETIVLATTSAPKEEPAEHLYTPIKREKIDVPKTQCTQFISDEVLNGTGGDVRSLHKNTAADSMAFSGAINVEPKEQVARDDVAPVEKGEKIFEKHLRSEHDTARTKLFKDIALLKFPNKQKKGRIEPEEEDDHENVSDDQIIANRSAKRRKLITVCDGFEITDATGKTSSSSVTAPTSENNWTSAEESDDNWESYSSSDNDDDTDMFDDSAVIQRQPNRKNVGIIDSSVRLQQSISSQGTEASNPAPVAMNVNIPPMNTTVASVSSISNESFANVAETLSDVLSYKDREWSQVRVDLYESKNASTSPASRTDLLRDEIDNAAYILVKGTGLEGRDLYRCSFADCDEHSDDIFYFNCHLELEHSQSQSGFKCYHCNVTSKTIVDLTYHIMVHGIHRYFCYYCNYTSAIVNDIQKHMTNTHNKSLYNTIPLNPNKQDLSKDMFVVCPRVLRPYDLERFGITLIDRNKRQNMALKRFYSPDNIESLRRRQAYFNRSILWDYSKVPTNVYHHRSFVPSQFVCNGYKCPRCVFAHPDKATVEKHKDKLHPGVLDPAMLITRDKTTSAPGYYTRVECVGNDDKTFTLLSNCPNKAAVSIPESTETLGTSTEAPNVIESDQPNIEPVAPLYGLVSNDSVIFGSEAMKPRKNVSLPQAEGFNNSTHTTPNPKPVSGVKRMVLIDGDNVALSHSRNKEFSVEGIAICLRYFLEREYECTAIVPQMRLECTKSNNRDLLAKLASDGRVVFSPCKELDDGTKITSNGDRVILDFAADFDAAVISNDNYSKLSKESEKYKEIIGTRVIGFTFLKDVIRFPQDPYGQFGPSLDEILNGKEK